MVKRRFSLLTVGTAFVAGCLVTATFYSVAEESNGLNPFLVPPPLTIREEKRGADDVPVSGSAALNASNALPSPTPASASSIASASPKPPPFSVSRSTLVNDTNLSEVNARLDLTDTAWVSMATSDESAVLALTLFQSLRDVGTRVPHLVLMAVRGGRGSAHCADEAWRREHKRVTPEGKDIHCGSPLAMLEEIINEQLLERFKALGVEILLMNTIPRNKYTEGIAGGEVFFWGAALSKLQVFNLTQYRKVIWLDGDDYFLKNGDWLFALPPMSGSMTMACANVNGPQYAGGGIWVLEPSTAIYDALVAFSNTPNPDSEDGQWLWGDMEIIRRWAGLPPPLGTEEPYFPAVNDRRHGYAPGLRYFSHYKAMTDQQFEEYLKGRMNGKKPHIEGFIDGMEDKVLADNSTAVVVDVSDEVRKTPLGKRIPPVWMAIDIRFDYCVGSMFALPYLHDLEALHSVHFSCLQHTGKPSQYYSKSEKEMMQHLYDYVDGHARYWIAHVWYPTYVRASGSRFKAPYWEGPPVPGINATHDIIVERNRKRNPDMLRRHLLESQSKSGEVLFLRQISPLQLERGHREGFLNDHHHHSYSGYDGDYSTAI